MFLTTRVMPAPSGINEAPVSHRKRVRDKLLFFIPALRQKLMPRRNLLAGPFAGEFGWELMQWQGYVRVRHRNYQQVHVLTYPGRDYLYEGCQVHHHDIRLEQAGYDYGWLAPAEARQMAQSKATELELKDYDIFGPWLICTQYHKRLLGPQEFRLFQERPLTDAILDLAFHFRAVRKQGPDQENKNYSPQRAQQLVERCREKGLSVCCIGHPDYAYCPPGCTDYRSVDLRGTVAAICSARLVAGENSGPMHLANLCGKPTIVWAQDQWRIDYSLRWNPFRVRIYVAANNTSQPAPDLVSEAIGNALQDLRVKTRDFTQSVYTVPAQPIAYY
jgi:hypothetical protein